MESELSAPKAVKPFVSSGLDVSIEHKVRAAGLTDVGLKREHNEDSMLVAKDLGLFSVADGMGGHAAGEVASAAAISAVEDFVHQARDDENITWPFGTRTDLDSNENILLSALSLANQKVCSLSKSDTSLGGMGTTVVALYLVDDKAHVGHVGDSRLYRFRDGVLEIVTQDHSWVNEQLQRNIISEEEARTHRWRNVITRALGSRDDIEVDIQTLETQPGDLFLLCSDGLTSMMSDAEISETLNSGNVDPPKICEELVRLANEAGGLDNVSVIVVQVDA